MSDHRKYFIPKKARELHMENGDGIELRVYNNGVYDVCPNPNLPGLEEQYRRQYDSCHFITCEIFIVPKEEFDNPLNWRS